MDKRILAIGHVTKDLIITPKDKYTQIGGSVFYQTITLNTLKTSVTSIISVGEDELEMLGELGENHQYIIRKKSLEYTNIYDEKLHRTQKATLPKNPIKAEDIRIDLKTIKTAIISPLSPYDIAPETMELLKEKKIKTVLLPQGFLRQTDDDNNIIARTWTDREIYLENTDILCLDEREAKQAFEVDEITDEKMKEILEKHSLEQVIITMAERGSVIHTKNKTYTIPSFKAGKQVDATGLGDTYIAAYISKLEETGDILLSGIFASITAKEKLEHKGPLKKGKEKIEKELDDYRQRNKWNYNGKHEQ